jgi:PIN domain nuclease of toxin-antitoxin system
VPKGTNVETHTLTSLGGQSCRGYFTWSGVSSVSGWEIAIKRALGKLDAPRELGAAIDDAGFVRRLIRFEDCEKLERLPSHHRDPFDRMLVAQALVDGVPVVTRDPWIARYGVQTIW